MTRTLAFALLAFVPAIQAQTDAQLRYACKGFIERMLHDPHSAELDWTQGRASKNSKGLWVVQFRGRAKNAYGALRLATFQCVLRYQVPDNFTLIDAKVF